MNKLKKIMSVVLALCCTATMALSVGMSVNAISDDEFYTETKETFDSINTSKLYYDKNTGKLYIKAIKSNARGTGNGYNIWLYELNDNCIAEEKNRLEYSVYFDDQESVFHYHYSINFKECSLDKFYKQYTLYDDNYTEIDAEQGMTELEVQDNVTTSTDYSYVSNITLDIDDSQKLLPKVILNEKDNLKITWSSSDSNVATVDDSGNVTATNSGNCTISAKLEGLEENIAEYNIRVKTNDEVVKTAAMQFAKEQEQYYALSDIDNDGENELITSGNNMSSGSDIDIDIYEYRNGQFENVATQEIRLTGIGRDSYIKSYNNKLYTIAISGSSQASISHYSFLISEYKDNAFEEFEKISYYGLFKGQFDEPLQGKDLEDWEELNHMKYDLSNNKYMLNDKESTFEDVKNEIDTVLKKYIDYPNLIFTPYNTQESDYIFFDSDVRYLTESEIKTLDSDSIQNAINEIYARHGYKFKDEELNNYFNEKSWYSGYVEDINSIEFNAYEDKNLELLAKYR